MSVSRNDRFSFRSFTSPLVFDPSQPSSHVAVLGASGAVGKELLLLLEERHFPVGELKLLASARSAGQTQAWNGRTLTVEEVSAQSFEGCLLYTSPSPRD